MISQIGIDWQAKPYRGVLVAATWNPIDPKIEVLVRLHHGGSGFNERKSSYEGIGIFEYQREESALFIVPFDGSAQELDHALLFDAHRAGAYDLTRIDCPPLPIDADPYKSKWGLVEAFREPALIQRAATQGYSCWYFKPTYRSWEWIDPNIVALWILEDSTLLTDGSRNIAPLFEAKPFSRTERRQITFKLGNWQTTDFATKRRRSNSNVKAKPRKSFDSRLFLPRLPIVPVEPIKTKPCLTPEKTTPVAFKPRQIEIPKHISWHFESANMAMSATLHALVSHSPTILKGAKQHRILIFCRHNSWEIDFYGKNLIGSSINLEHSKSEAISRVIDFISAQDIAQYSGPSKFARYIVGLQ